MPRRAATTRSPYAATTADRTSISLAVKSATMLQSHAQGMCCRRAALSPSRASAAFTSLVTQEMRRPCSGCVSAKAARRSPSPSCCAASTPCGASAASATHRKRTSTITKSPSCCWKKAATEKSLRASHPQCPRSASCCPTRRCTFCSFPCPTNSLISQIVSS